MCRVLGVSRAHYYRYKAHKPSKRSLEDKDLKQRICRIFVEFKQRYGVMKIHYELSKELQPLQRRCSPRRVSRLMKEMDIHSIANQIAAWFNAFHGSNKLLIEINDLFELWKLNAVLDLP